jgi:tetratricopeptide (TPR) repeat protein
MLNIGPLSNFLYKESVKSRGEFFRTAITGANDNPIFGVGLDSFGDVSQFYKSANDYAGINEFTDSAHNYFFQYAVTGGYPLAIFYFLLTLLTLGSFFVLQKRIGEFNYKLSAVFSAWIGFQAQSLISPGSIPIILWGSIFSGSIIGLSVWGMQERDVQTKSLNSLFKPFSYFLLFLGLLLIYPYFNADRLQLKSLNTKDAFLAVKSAKMYPESVLRYSRIGVKLLESDLPDQALEVGRAAVKFNPDAISAWALILANNSAPMEERKNAQKEILRLDPFNDEIRRIEFPAK